MSDIEDAIKKVDDEIFDPLSDYGIVDPGNEWASAIGNSDVLSDISGDTAKEAAEDAQKKQEDAALAAIEENKNALNLIRGDLAPYRDSGLVGIPMLNNLLQNPQNLKAGLVDPNNVQASPGFQFQLNQGFDQIQNSAAARGKLGSGGTLKALEDYRQGLASTYVPQYQNQLMSMRQQQFGENLTADQNRYGQIYDATRLGANAAAQTGTQTASMAGNNSNLLTQIGNSQAAGQIGAAQAQQQGTQNILGLILTAAAAACDRRLKENITEVGVDDDGLPLYEWNYIGKDERYLGKMADDIQAVDPSHVSTNEDGYLMVTQKYAPVRLS